MKRIHDTARLARYELMIAGFRPLGLAPGEPQAWAKPGALTDRRVIRREIQGADERWVIERAA